MANQESHSIKISDDVYRRLQRLQGPRETYSEVVERCLSIVEGVKGFTDMLGPSHYLKERPKVEARVD